MKGSVNWSLLSRVYAWSLLCCASSVVVDWCHKRLTGLHWLDLGMGSAKSGKSTSWPCTTWMCGSRKIRGACEQLSCHGSESASMGFPVRRSALRPHLPRASTWTFALAIAPARSLRQSRSKISPPIGLIVALFGGSYLESF